MTRARGTNTGLSGQLPPHPRRPARLALAVIEALADQIVSGQLPAGSQLPPEPTLCEIFGVSRITVREAVKSLEEKGLVLARQGSGTTVTEQDGWTLLDPIVLAAVVRHDTQLTLLDQLVDVRARLGNDRPSLVSMAGVSGGRPIVIVATNDRGRELGLKAGVFVKVAAQVLGGGGGGKDDIAQGGGTDPAMVSTALGAVEEQLRQRGV